MNRNSLAVKTVSLTLAVSVLFASCSSTTLIQTGPKGAKVYLNGEPVGTTPYTHTDTKILGSVNYLKIEKEGYETLNTTFSRDEAVDVGAIVGGIFVLVPFLWTLKYKPVHNYELVPLQQTNDNSSITTPLKSKTERLAELKKLMDEKLISKDDFEKEKKKILDEE